MQRASIRSRQTRPLRPCATSRRPCAPGLDSHDDRLYPSRARHSRRSMNPPNRPTRSAAPSIFYGGDRPPSTLSGEIPMPRDSDETVLEAIDEHSQAVETRFGGVDQELKAMKKELKGELDWRTELERKLNLAQVGP